MSLSKNDITSELLQSLYTIDLDAGRFFWKRPPRCNSHLLGKEAGCEYRGKDGESYWIMKIASKRYNRSRLVFFLVHGRFPYPCVDHIDGNSLSDRPENLREATFSQNQCNHKLAYEHRKFDLPMGVYLSREGRFQAQITFKNKRICLGTFATVEQAHGTYLKKREELFGEFVRKEIVA